MESSKLSEWLQSLTSIGVLVGLVLVAYEIRQNTNFAKAETSRQIYGLWTEVSQAELETEIGDIVFRAIEDPESLSPQEIFKYNAWLAMIIYQYDQGVRLYALGVSSIYSGMTESDARYYFSSELSRKWFDRARRWIQPENVAVIERVIESTPISTKYEY